MTKQEAKVKGYCKCCCQWYPVWKIPGCQAERLKHEHPNAVPGECPLSLARLKSLKHWKEPGEK